MKKRTTPLERADALLAAYDDLQGRAEELIDEYVAGLVAKAPGVPAKTVRLCSIDSHADGYSHVAALRHLRTKLEADHPSRLKDVRL